MQSLREAAQKEGISVPISLKSFMQNYGTNSLKTLFTGVALHQGEITSADLGGGYRLMRQDSTVKIMAADGSLVSSVKAPSDKVEKSEQFFRETSKGLFKYFQQKGEDIKNGKIKAAEIGAAVYGIAASVILIIYAPLAKIGQILAQIANVGVSVGAERIGEYYGAIVDDFVAILKGEDDPTIADIVGTMGVVYFTFTIPVGATVRLFGTDGWSFTKEVGKAVGGKISNVIDSIESVVSDVGDVIGDAADWVGDIF
ncbi:hypothetical protein [Microcoleus sp. SVA1_A1]|uniref:hypothetical protein n=1 Tax=Microcoleus sp. SVA1_A1 TaxID=2818946 RepID=UPI002FD11E0D